MNVHIGKIGYTNTLPFYHGLDAALAKSGLIGRETYRHQYTQDCPAKINLAMRKGRLQIAPISSLEYLNHQGLYWLLPDLCIGSRDFSGSVILFSKEKIEGLNKAKIALTRQSLSSAMLLRLILKFKFKFENRFTLHGGSPEEMLKLHPAALVIGDDALFFESEDFYYRYDMSELWWNWTEMPFCFSVWAVRRDFAREHPEYVVYFHRKLRQNLDRNLVDLETLIKDALGMSFMDPRFSTVFGYLFNLHYGLDAPMRQGLELFYRLAHRSGASPRPEKLGFFKGCYLAGQAGASAEPSVRLKI